DRVVAVDMESGDVTEIANGISQARGLVLATNATMEEILYVASSNQHAIYAITPVVADEENGVQPQVSLVSKSGTGGRGLGPSLLGAVGLAMEVDGSRLLVGGSASLSGVDPESGDRTAISVATTGTGPLPQRFWNIALNPLA